MPLELASKTDVGKKRDHNEDDFRLDAEIGFLTVCDGMGGHNAGEVASDIAVRTILEFMQQNHADPDKTWPYKFDPKWDMMQNLIANGVRLCNDRIRQVSMNDFTKKGMGSTLVAGQLVGSKFYVGHLGDSRGYLVRRGEIMPITEDHSLYNEWLKLAPRSEEEKASFGHKNVITRALGQTEACQPDVNIYELEANDIVVLCCDGLSGMVPDPKIAEIVASSKTLDKACDRLIDSANAAGGIDNITVILGRYTP